ncbi:hypothetical protein [Marisediminicola senii]|uniref:hypothetical protein n=1 Tax=Marisediminicola senii TaxID=2711233 RepID=UPI0013EA3B96|nr:hypothetical protein [Marisediminicola senii]
MINTFLPNSKGNGIKPGTVQGTERASAIDTRYVVPAVGFIAILICVAIAGWSFAGGDTGQGWMLIGFAALGIVAIVGGQIVIRKKNMYRIK